MPPTISTRPSGNIVAECQARARDLSANKILSPLRGSAILLEAIFPSGPTPPITNKRPLSNGVVVWPSGPESWRGFRGVRPAGTRAGNERSLFGDTVTLVKFFPDANVRTGP